MFCSTLKPIYKKYNKNSYKFGLSHIIGGWVTSYNSIQAVSQARPRHITYLRGIWYDIGTICIRYGYISKSGVSVHPRSAPCVLWDNDA